MKRRGLLGALLGAALTPVAAIAKVLPAATPSVDPFGQYGFVSAPVMSRYWAREMLRQAQLATPLERIGAARPLPEYRGKTIKFRRYMPYLGDTGILDGTTPSSQPGYWQELP